jgi:hypothetical protein
MEPVDDRPSWRRAEVAIAAVTLAYFSEAFVAKLLAPEATTDEQSAFVRTLWYPFYALVLVGVTLSWRRALLALAVSPLIVVMVALAQASPMWSIDPALSQ